MFRIIVISAVLCFTFIGCKTQDKKQISVSEEGILNVTEADSLLAPSKDESIELTAENTSSPGNTSITMAMAPAPTTENETAPVQEQSDDPDSKTIQQALKDLGFYQGEIDGKIGPKTKAAIKEFQTKSGLEADGKVGPRTWAALKEALASQPAVDKEQ